MKRFVILAVLLVCQQAQADTYILVFDSYPSDEGRQVANLLKQDVPKPVHCHYIGHAQATKAVFAKNLRWLKGKAQKGDIAIVYVSAHGSPGTNKLWIGASHGPDVPSSLIRETTEALPCPSVVLIDTCFAGSALREPWKKTTVVCAVNDHEVSWTGGMSKAVCQEICQGRHPRRHECQRPFSCRSSVDCALWLPAQIASQDVHHVEAVTIEQAFGQTHRPANRPAVRSPAASPTSTP